jgi:hypothetical protein
MMILGALTLAILSNSVDLIGYSLLPTNQRTVLSYYQFAILVLSLSQLWDGIFGSQNPA